MSKTYQLNTLEGLRDALSNYEFIRPSEHKHYMINVPIITQRAYMPHDAVSGFPVYVNIELVTLPDSTNTNVDGVITVNVGPEDAKPHFSQVSDFVVKKGLCSNLAESIYANLRNKMEYGLKFKDRKNLYNWTFQTIANNYIGRIKAYPEYRDLELFPDNESIDVFRKLFSEFIEDRNLYTHGQIAILRNTNSICIQNADRVAHKMRYYDIQDTHFSHFSFVFAIIDSCIHLNGKAAQKSQHAN